VPESIDKTMKRNQVQLAAYLGLGISWVSACAVPAIWMFGLTHYLIILAIVVAAITMWLKEMWLTISACVGFVGLCLIVFWPAISAFQNVRASQQDKTVINNLRQIQTGAAHYFAEHPGVSSVASTTIVGTNSSQYVKGLVTVAQETYTATIVQGAGISASGVGGARTVTYGP